MNISLPLHPPPRSVSELVSAWEGMCRLYDAYTRLSALVEQQQQQQAAAGGSSAIASVRFHLLWIAVTVNLAGEQQPPPSGLPRSADIFVSFDSTSKALKVEAAPPWQTGPDSPLTQWLSPAMAPLTHVANGKGGMRALFEALSLALPSLPVLASAEAADLTYHAIDACTGILYSPISYGVEVRFAHSGLVLLRDATLSQEYQKVRAAPEAAGGMQWLSKLEGVPYLPAFLHNFVKQSGAMAQTREDGIAVVDLEAMRNLVNVSSPAGGPPSLSRYLGCLRSRLGLLRAASYYRELCTINTNDLSNPELCTWWEGGVWGRERDEAIFLFLFLVCSLHCFATADLSAAALVSFLPILTPRRPFFSCLAFSAGRHSAPASQHSHQHSQL